VSNVILAFSTVAIGKGQYCLYDQLVRKMILKFTIGISLLLTSFFAHDKTSSALATEPVAPVTHRNIETASALSEETMSGIGLRAYKEIGLTGIINQEAFVSAYTSMLKYNKTAKSVLAIADMSLPSTEKRLYLIDIKTKRFIARTYVAHGTNTGELFAKKFSNKVGSHQSSKGLYEVGHRIISPKHGPALLLYGLEGGLNDKAEEREIIIHKADYVSRDFIKENGHLGRSWGCPAVSEEAMPVMLRHLTSKGLLYVYA